MNWINFAYKSLTITLLTIVLAACSDGGASAEDYNIELYTPTYAKGFNILKAEGSQSTLLEIHNPWQGAQGISKRLFIARDGQEAPHGFDGEVITGDAQRIVTMSSTQVAMLSAAGSVSSIVGVSGIEYISNEYIASKRDSIADVGYEGNIDYELLLSLSPDIVLLYSINSASTMEAKLKELGIPFVYIGEYLEQSPLGKAEWIIAVAEIVGRREQGERLFEAIPKRYNSLKARASEIDVTQKPKVMINTPYASSWVMAANDSYVAQLIADAGGDYIYSSKSSSSRSEAIDIEEAYSMSSKADIWINLGRLSSRSELKAQFPKFADIPCVVRGEVYNSNKRLNPSGSDDYWESGVINPDVVLSDLITIFHPSLSSDSLVYYHKLK